MGWWLSIQQSLLPKCHGHLRSASQRTRTAHLLPATSPTEALSPGAWGRRYLPQGGGCLFLGSLTFTTGHKTDPSKTGHLENAGQREASCGREKQGCEEEITHWPSQSAELQKQTNKRRNVLSEDLEEGVRMLSTHFKHRDSGRLRNRWTEMKAAAAARVRGAGSGRGGRGRDARCFLSGGRGDTPLRGRADRSLLGSARRLRCKARGRGTPVQVRWTDAAWGRCSLLQGQVHPRRQEETAF